MSIPIRNIWWLMLYASDLGKSTDLAQRASACSCPPLPPCWTIPPGGKLA